ncbi:MAG TPA: phage tail protein, partial [Kofleriaceae bacterium]
MRTLLAQTIESANYAAAQAEIATEAVQMIAGLAPLASPVFTGNPQAPTPALGDSSTSIATTLFLARLLGAASGIATLGSDGKLTSSQLPPISITAVYTVASQAAMLALSSALIGSIAIRTDMANAEFILTALPASTLANWTQIGTSPVLSVAGLTGAIASGDLMTALGAAPLASPALTGAPTAPTAAPGNNSTQIATTAFVVALAALLAPLASPSLTGVPSAPTATIDTNTGQLATTAFVLGQGSQSGDGVPIVDGAAARGTSTHFARADHIHPTDTSRAPLASPAFTGSPTAPTPTGGDNSTKLATTAFVQSATSGLGAPTGQIASFPANVAPTGWVKANGAALSRTTYAALWSYAQASGNLAASEGAKDKGQFGPGDGSTTFSIPDMRGYFARSWDDGAGVDSGRAIGTSQADAFASHTHTITTGISVNSAGSAFNYQNDATGTHNSTGSTG